MVENRRAVVIYNIGMNDLTNAEVRSTIDSAISNVLLLEQDDNSGYVFKI